MKRFKLSKEEEQRALDIHRRSIVIDGSVIPIEPIGRADEYFQRMTKGGVTASNASWPSACRLCREAIGFIIHRYRWISSSDKLLLATSVANIEQAKKEGKGAIIFGPQKIDFIEDDLGLLTIFHKLGIRVMQLTYNERNFIGDGCMERTDCGLSKFGVQVIEEMNRLGMLIDLSHCSGATTLEAIELSKDPVVFTHAHSRSLCDNVRNKTDEQIKALAEKGGVIGLTAISDFIELRREIRPSLNDFLDHVDYVVKMVGADHVGIGLDIDENETKETWEALAKKLPYIRPTYEDRFVEGLESITQIPNITRGLVARGYSNQEIEKILGGNFLRVFRRVWRK